MGKVVGIDLGTTNSCVSVMEGGKPTVIANAEGFRTTPSVVAYTKNQDQLVGQIAKRQAVMNPENTFYSVKRFIGCKYDEIVSEINRIPYKVQKDNNGNIKIYSPVLKKEFSPEEISASILKKLATDASKFLKENVTQAIVTVPAYFNDSQRLATKDAGTIAGLEVLRILNEPTAAALAYGLDKKKNEVVLIFDLGGGTFDVSVLEVCDEVFEVLSTSGDTHLGGDDFDQAIVNYIIKTFQKTEGIDLYKEKQALQRIIEASEKAKIELSALQSTRISLPFIYIDGQNPKHIDLEFKNMPDQIQIESIAMKDYCASARLYDRMIETFLTTAIGWDPKYKCSLKEGGLFGKVNAYYGMTETQGGATLHCHLLIWLHGPPKTTLQYEAQDKEQKELFNNQLISYANSIISSTLPSRPDLVACTSCKEVCAFIPLPVKKQYREKKNQKQQRSDNSNNGHREPLLAMCKNCHSKVSAQHLIRISLIDCIQDDFPDLSQNPTFELPASLSTLSNSELLNRYESELKSRVSMEEESFT
jgi:actin-like ATPase involved in cell morphogenesis